MTVPGKNIWDKNNAPVIYSPEFLHIRTKFDFRADSCYNDKKVNYNMEEYNENQ